MKTTNIQKRERRHRKIRARVSGTAEIPRLSMFKSNKYLSAQLIDDEKAVTIVSASDKNLPKGTGLEKAGKVGEIIATDALKKKIEKVVFDRGGFQYTGKIKALADGARAKGLKF